MHILFDKTIIFSHLIIYFKSLISINLLESSIMC